MKCEMEDLVDQIFFTFLKEQLYRVINTVGKYYTNGYEILFSFSI